MKQRTKQSKVLGKEKEEEGFLSGTSIFDPVLCELMYAWFCPKEGTVVDPFAGGSVRGIIASAMGLQYYGVDLRGAQVQANKEQWLEIKENLQPSALPPVWIEGDSEEIRTHLKGVEADFIFSCPPYADLEVYSDDKRDISNMPYNQFVQAYFSIITRAVSLLKDNRFACFVVGDARDKDGFYYGFPADTVKAFEAAGMRLYNEAVLVTAIGSLPIRVGRQFSKYRKLGKTHQNILVFFKGDPKTIQDNFPEATNIEDSLIAQEQDLDARAQEEEENFADKVENMQE